MKLTGL